MAQDKGDAGAPRRHARALRDPAPGDLGVVVVSTLIAWVGVYSVVGLTGITLASNSAPSSLYGLTCVWTIIAFAGRRSNSVVKHLVVPGLGLIANLAMLGAIPLPLHHRNADSQHEAYICFAIAGAWAALSLIYVGGDESARPDAPCSRLRRTRSNGTDGPDGAGRRP